MRQARGFTLVELLVVMTISAILLAVGVPAFGRALSSLRLTTTVNELLAAIDAGRGHALAHGVRVVLAPNAGNDWASGWRLYRDLNDNGVLDEGDEVLRVFDRRHPRMEFELVGAQASAAMSFQDQGFIRRAGSNGMMLGRMIVKLDGQVRTLCFAAVRVRVVKADGCEP